MLQSVLQKPAVHKLLQLSTSFANKQALVTLRCLFLLYVLTFSFDAFFRDFFAVLCVACLIPYYTHNYQESTLCRFGAKKLFLFYYAFLAVGIIFSQNKWDSFTIVALHSFTSLSLPFVAMESIRSEKDLRYVIYALITTLFVQGCNGIFQYFSGYDLFHGTAIRTGRLTGSFSDYRVGNYLALSLIPAFGIFFILREKYSRITASPLTLLLLTPALFLMFFSYTRNAYITIVAAMMLWAILRGLFPWKSLLAAGISALILMQISDFRLSWTIISNDGRWSLWRMAIRIFEEFPLFGTGIGQYNSAFLSLGLVPNKDAVTVLHPHNIYLQFLCENGLVGLCLISIFLLGMLYWGYKNLVLLRIRRNLQWRIIALFWCGWGAYLASGIFGHNFYQRWWQALAMAYLGIMIGPLVHAIEQRKAQKAKEFADK